MTWLNGGGYGFFEVTQPAHYGQAYFDKYVGYADTELGHALTRYRVGLVNSYLQTGASVVDIGIGCGQFVETMSAFAPTFGFDINPVAVDWLATRRKFRDPLLMLPGSIGALTFWDSFEHIRRPLEVLACRPRFVFMSLPIFRDAEHVLVSKHFRPDEHFWYFTVWGLIREMARVGYECLEVSRAETRLGREDIASFAFITGE